jgi:hypothetical protein
VVGSKYFTIPWTNFLLGGGIRLGLQSMADALDETIKRLGTDSVDLYQIHFPFPSYSQETLMNGLRDAMESGKARAVGVCNYDARQLEEAHGLLAKNNIPLASNQVGPDAFRNVDVNTALIPKEGQVRFAGQASRSNKFAMFCAADNRNKLFLDLEGYLRTLALSVTWPSFGNTTVSYITSLQVVYRSLRKGRPNNLCSVILEVK